MQITLEGRVAIVTGAAHGIGRAICRLLGQAGASIWAVDILAEELAATVAAVAEAGGDCRAVVVDVTDAPAVQACVNRVLREAGRVDILVNSAGGVCGQVGQAVEEVSDAEWDVVVRTNLYSAFYFIRAVAPAMKRQGGRRIVNTIAPGFIRSNPTTERQWEALGEEGQRRLVEAIALRRLGAPEDIAGGVLYFASDLAQWVTGQTISIDGGRHMA
jgi:3-oxoacyl-[acyl-carrier protein] reductase